MSGKNLASFGAAAVVLACLGGSVAVAAPVVQEAPTGTAAAASFYANKFEKRPTFAGMVALGRNLFFDPRLSASGRQACSSCHDPARDFGPPNDSSVQHGGLDGRGDGLRAVPALRYTQDIPRFTEHFFEDDGNDSEDQGPTGGRTWDGRAQTAHEQALLPLFSPLEMANASPADIASRLRTASYAQQMREVYGNNVLDQAERALKAVLLALEVFQQSPVEFYPYDSKYDAWLRRMASLTPAEERGMALFNDPAKGNCASCHPSGIKEGGFPQFTDYGYIALAVPRNRDIAANSDPQFYDLGLCGPLREDLRDRPDTCGKFRTPSLRNVARRPVYFHNGSVKKLEDAVRFYATRDTQPEAWYPRAADGSVQKFDDLPTKYQGNIENKPPFGQQAGGKPVLNDAEIADIVAFLNTLSDGYRPEARP